MPLGKRNHGDLKDAKPLLVRSRNLDRPDVPQAYDTTLDSRLARTIPSESFAALTLRASVKSLARGTASISSNSTRRMAQMPRTTRTSHIGTLSLQGSRGESERFHCDVHLPRRKRLIVRIQASQPET